MGDEVKGVRGIRTVNGPTRAALDEVEFVDCCGLNENPIEWSLNEGKHPDTAGATGRRSRESHRST